VANVQKHFEEFHASIRLGRFSDEATLREKRDIIKSKLEAKLPAEFAKRDEECPPKRFVDQGSYEMGTGIKPVAGDFDIDQGLYFELDSDQFPNPVDLKKVVRDALEGHTDKVEIRRSCVTVFYQREGEDIYHVDLAIYRESGKDALPKLIGKGKEQSNSDYRFWEVSDSAGLSHWFRRDLDSAERKQTRRLVRYLKRWKDENFDVDGRSAPTGIALTVGVRANYAARFSDTLTKTPNDLAALASLITSLLGQFHAVVDAEGNTLHRLELRLPVEPFGDLLEAMSDKQSESLHRKMTTLKAALLEAENAVDPVDACTRLRREFGEDFPVPDPSDTAARVAPTILRSSSSA
jgi:hypothetical protein